MVSMSHSLDSTLGPMAPFVSQLLAELAATGITIPQPTVDHLCYRAAT
ncbi:MAG: VOC family protein, partial [Aeromonas sobria]